MKQHVFELAAFGGEPQFREPLHVGRPNIGNRQVFMERIEDILDRRWLTNHGPYVEEFERRIAEFVGVKHCIVMCNATIALEIMIRAAGLQGEVIVPSMTFVATAHALQWQEITPVFCDIDPVTCTIDPKQVESMITPRTTGIIGVHLWGRACQIDELTEIAERHHLKLMFDAAHSFGCTYKGQMIGNFGEAEVLSFHATKFLNSLEGGAIVTNNDELAGKARLMQNFGFEDTDSVIYVGTNGKMNEVSAAMGITSLESINEFIGKNCENYHLYEQELAGINGVRLMKYDETEKTNYQYVVLDFDEAVIGVSRDQMKDILGAENVLSRRYFYPGCHRMEPYRSYFPHAGLLLPVTERVSRRVLSMPTGTAVSRDDIREICAIIRTVVNHADEIAARLADQTAVLEPG
jgi:dTDP-4-amino-4,6-dideoxygalactose transaminase